MMPRNTSNNRRPRKNGKPQAVISMTQSEAFEMNQVQSSDAVVIKGKYLGNAGLTTAPQNLLSFNPQGLGSRSTNMATIFSRYRIKYVRIKWLSTNGTTASSIALGVLDDASGSEGDAPINLGDVAELRASSTIVGNTTVPQLFTWEPVDRRLWYATYSGATGSDPRFSIPGVLYLAATGAVGGVAYELDYSVVFAGAVDTGAS